MTADREKAAALATRAYHAAVRGDWPAANKTMSEAGRQNPNVIALVLTAFCDTTISLQRGIRGMPPMEDGIPEGSLVQPLWVNADTGHATMNADDMPPALRWAGQMVAARAALDFDGYQALLLAMPTDGFKRGEYANTLLMSCVSLTRIAGDHGAAEPGGAA
jgi:hypothetical protein